MSAFKDILNWYEDVYKSKNNLTTYLSSRLERKEYREVSTMDGELKLVKMTHDKIKKILKDNFTDEINKEVEITQKLYDKEHDFAVSAWNSYGSELAGDFNAGEVKAQKKLTLLKEILK